MKRSLNTETGVVLIELLIATAIAGLLIAVVLAVYASILNTVAAQNRWREKTVPAAEALDIMIRDLACVAIPLGITNQLFSADRAATSDEIFGMSFYSAFPTWSSNDWRSYSISRVYYSLRPGDRPDEFILVRECKPFRVPSRNQLSVERKKWRGIRKLDLAFFDGLAWTNQWGHGKVTNAIPKAARIGLISGQNEARELRSEVFINAGNQIVPLKSK